MIRVKLPPHLRTLTHSDGEVKIDVEGEATQRSVLDALEACYPMLRGTIRDQISQQRRPFLRFFACERDLSHEPPDAPLPDGVASGAESLLIIGALAGGQEATMPVHTSSESDVTHSSISEFPMTPLQERKHKGSILIIGEGPASLKLLFTILTEDGYAVHERQLDLESHLRFVKDTLPDLVLVDVRKVGRDGYQVCASLKNDPTTRAIPVIFIGAIDRSINQTKALVSGAVDYVTDPFDAQEVLWRIETHISLRRLRENLKSMASNHSAQPVAPNGNLEKAFQEIQVLTQVTGRKHAEEKVRQSSRDLKKAEKALQSSERNLAAIINAIPTAAWTTRPDGNCDFINQVWLDYTGLTAERAQGWGWAETIHPDDREQLVESWRSSLASAIPVDTEARIRRFDSSYRWFLIRANPLRDESGNILKWYGTCIDIEDRKRWEQTLHARELSWRQIVDNIPGLVGTTGAMGELEFLNRQTLEYFGKTTEELKDWALINAVHPDDLPRVIEARKKSIEAGQIYEVEHRCRRADGVYRWFQVRGLPVRDAENKVAAWYLLLTDIDDRKTAEEALQSSQHDLSIMIDAIPGMIHTARPDGYLDYFNRRWLEYLGCSLSDVEGWNWTGLIHPDDLQGILDNWRACIASGETLEYETRVRRSDGQYRWMIHRKVPLRDEHGNIVRWYGASLDIEDRKRAEAALQSSQRNLSLMISAIPTYIHVLRSDGSVLYVNQAVMDFFGITLDDAQKEDYRARFFHPEDVERLREERREALTRPVPFENEQRVLGKDGKYRWFLIRYNPLLDEQGKIDRWYVAATDIDDRKRAEEALRQSEERARLMVDSIDGQIMTATPKGEVEFVNQQVLDYFGKSLEELKDWRTNNAIHPDDFPRALALWAHSVETGDPYQFDERLRRADGAYRWFRVRGRCVRDAQGHAVRWYVLLTDIDEGKRAETQVEQAYLRLAEAQRLSKTGSFITDLTADEHSWSEETFRIFEFDPATKVTLQRVRDIIHPEDLPSFEAMIGRAMTGVDVDFVFRIVTSRGTVKHIRGMARVIEQIAGRPLFIGALQDITESKVAEEALNKARAELAHVARVTTLNVLTASVAHEINQPLASLITNASICLRRLNADPPNVDGARETVMRAIRDGNRASDVITRLRALYTKKELTLEPLDLNAATQEVIALSLSDLQGNRVILKSELADGLPLINGDRVQLQQVILNLVRNASDAMGSVEDRPRELLIRTERDGADRVRLSVKDVGLGFTPEAADRLFQAFYTTKSHGMGIGLHVSRSIIEAHHGHLWAAANDGPGATFSFAIPCRPKTLDDIEGHCDRTEAA